MFIFSETALRIAQGVFHYLHDIFNSQMLQLKNLASRKKCGINIEEGFSDRRGNQDNVALFHIGQQCILLEFVEPVISSRKRMVRIPFALRFRADCIIFRRSSRPAVAAFSHSKRERVFSRYYLC